MEKSLDIKIRNILADPGSNDFIIADAKDGDMGFGVAAPGISKEPSHLEYGTVSDHRDNMRMIVEQGLVDIMLMSVSASEQLTIEERIFDNSTVTPAIRANDTSDIWCGLSANYGDQPSLPFRSTTIEHAQCGKVTCTDEERGRGADLGLYSITFNNDAQLDREALQAYKEFRIEAEIKGFRHFLEVFAPNAPVQPIADVPRYVNDCITRTLGGVTKAGRPVFLKIPYFGPEAMEQLAHYDSSIVVGILGGSSGTTHDAFRMLWESKKYGGHAALFGRKINNSEHQLTFVKFLRHLADGEIEPEQAVRDYHGELSKLGIQPDRSLEDDLQVTQF
ncbi:MAG: hypothetical protein CMJ76_08120 [Planctomycetaceae bacterium]|nr:hypothetical protein [Planctomycetaceae bacterium]|tara:strand:+ start:1807 stop:2808 length:1002 start_codon:yes stop_codon:yes gene_type:complete